MKRLLFRAFILLSIVLGTLIQNSSAAENILDLYRLAKISDPELRQAQLAQKIAIESRRQDFSRFLPTMSIGGDVTNNSQKRTYDVSQFDGEEEYNSYGYSLNLSQPVFRYENHVRYQQASDRIKQMHAELKLAEQSLIIRLAERYFDVLSAQDNIRFIGAEKSAVTRQLKQAEIRLDAGLAAITDVYEASAQLDSTKSLEIDARIQWDNSLESLREITQQYHDNLQPLNNALVLNTSDLRRIDEWVALGLASNLALSALRFDNQVLQRDISVQRTGHYPTLDLVAKYTKLNSGGGNFGRSDTEIRTVGVQLNIPLYQGGLTTARVKEAVFRYEQNLEKLDATRRSVRSEVRRAYFGVKGSVARIQSMKQSMISSAKALKAIEAGRGAGMRTTADVLNATQKLYQTERDYERARYDYVLNGLKLKKSTGTLSMSDLEQVNLWLK